MSIKFKEVSLYCFISSVFDKACDNARELYDEVKKIMKLL